MKIKIKLLNENALFWYREFFFMIVLDKSLILLRRIFWCDGEFKAT